MSFIENRLAEKRQKQGNSSVQCFKGVTDEDVTIPVRVNFIYIYVYYFCHNTHNYVRLNPDKNGKLLKNYNRIFACWRLPWLKLSLCKFLFWREMTILCICTPEFLLYDLLMAFVEYLESKANEISWNSSKTKNWVWKESQQLDVF